MTTETPSVERRPGGGPLARARAGGTLPELGVSAFLLGLGALVLYQTTQIPTEFVQRGPVGPRAIPAGVGVFLLVVGVVHALDVLRGGHGEAEEGEDVDTTHGADWRTLGIMTAAFTATVVLIGVLGWPVMGAVLFWVTARALGSRHAVRDLGIAVALSVGSYLLFNWGLGIDLPAGPLEPLI
jgi:putative tricarboxylic transport membrane protein